MTQEQTANGQWNHTYLALEDTKNVAEQVIKKLEQFPDDPTLQDALMAFKAARQRLHGLQQGMLP